MLSSEMDNAVVETFDAFVSAVETAAHRAVGRSDTDMTWWLGGIDDMRQAFAQGISAEGYVAAQCLAFIEG